MEPLSTRIKRLRAERGLSVSFVAKSIGVSESTYRDWEYGRDIRGEPYAKMAAAFGVSLTYLLLGEDAEAHIIVDRLNKVTDLLNFIRAHL